MVQVKQSRAKTINIQEKKGMFYNTQKEFPKYVDQQVQTNEIDKISEISKEEGSDQEKYKKKNPFTDQELKELNERINNKKISKKFESSVIKKYFNDEIQRKCKTEQSPKQTKIEQNQLQKELELIDYENELYKYGNDYRKFNSSEYKAYVPPKLQTKQEVIQNSQEIQELEQEMVAKK